jgi:hypothetical protein
MSLDFLSDDAVPVAAVGSAAFGEAIERGLTTHNPFARLRLPEAASGPKRNLSPDDVHALIAGTTDLMRPSWLRSPLLAAG